MPVHTKRFKIEEFKYIVLLPKISCYLPHKSNIVALVNFNIVNWIYLQSEPLSVVLDLAGTTINFKQTHSIQLTSRLETAYI